MWIRAIWCFLKQVGVLPTARGEVAGGYERLYDMTQYWHRMSSVRAHMSDPTQDKRENLVDVVKFNGERLYCVRGFERVFFRGMLLCTCCAV